MEKIRFDYSKLRGRIVEKCGSQKAFADKIGISENTLTNKLMGYTYFNQKDIAAAKAVLDIAPEDISTYFFTF